MCMIYKYNYLVLKETCVCAQMQWCNRNNASHKLRPIDTVDKKCIF